jgi:hypothetical protein
VLNCENAAIGDPAQDLATQRHLGQSFAAEVMRCPHKGGRGLVPNFEHRGRRLWALRESDGLTYALGQGDALERGDAIRTVRNGPILRASQNHRESHR